MARFQKNVKTYFKDNIGIIGALLILCIFLSVFPRTSEVFPTSKNLFNVPDIKEPLQRTASELYKPVSGLRYADGYYSRRY